MGTPPYAIEDARDLGALWVWCARVNPLIPAAGPARTAGSRCRLPCYRWILPGYDRRRPYGTQTERVRGTTRNILILYGRPWRRPG